QAMRLLCPGSERPAGLLVTQCDPFDVDLLNVSDAEEAKHRAQIAAGMFKRLVRAVRINPAARADDDDALAFQHSLRAVLIVAEGAAGPGDMVDPRLERGSDTEIIHRRP